MKTIKDILKRIYDLYQMNATTDSEYHKGREDCLQEVFKRFHEAGILEADIEKIRETL